MESDGKFTVSINLKSNRQIKDSSATATKPTDNPSPISTCAIKPHGKAIASSAVPTKPIGKAVASSMTTFKPNAGYGVSTAMSMKRHGKAPVSSADSDEAMLFTDVRLGPHEADLRFRLIHFWEARVPKSRVLIGEEMLLIDEQGNVIQGFIPAGRVETYLPQMTAGSVYRLRNFFGSNNKIIFRVSDHAVTVSFSWNSVLTILENIPIQFPEDRFRFHGHEDFQANCDQRGDLYDYIGHMKLVNGQAMTDNPIFDEVEIAKMRHVVVHVQTHDGPVLKLYLWDQAAKDFCNKFKSFASTPRVLLVTTVNPKRVGGTLAIASMASSRVFIDSEVQPTRDYRIWLDNNLDVANKTEAQIVTKRESVCIGDLISYIKQEGAKVAWFECTATIDDVIQDSSWYYISCGGCNSKAIKESTSLICNNQKCEHVEVTGVPQYLTKISVYDKSDQAVFVVLGDAGRELTGKHASELVATYFEANENVGADQHAPVPQALKDTIGQTFKFIVKVSELNLTGKIQSFIATKVLPPENP